MLAVLKSLRNSERLILPSLSISASSRSGSMEPFKPVCCKKKGNLSSHLIVSVNPLEFPFISFGTRQYFFWDKAVIQHGAIKNDKK